MEGHSAPVERLVRAEDRDGQHQQRRQDVNGIDFHQPIPDEPLVAGCGNAIPEDVRVVVRQDESAEDKKERYADVGRIGKQTAAAQRLRARDRQDDVKHVDEKCRVKPDSGQAWQFSPAHGRRPPRAVSIASSERAGGARRLAKPWGDSRRYCRAAWKVLSLGGRSARRDRKSTRLNSSHVKISYAVFCLKKKKRK